MEVDCKKVDHLAHLDLLAEMRLSKVQVLLTQQTSETTATQGFQSPSFAMPDFSTPAEHAFEEQTPDPSSTFSQASLSNASIPLYDRYEIPSTIAEIIENGYQTVALQFPDELLGESVLVYRALMKGIKATGSDKAKDVQCYVLGDSTYGRWVVMVLAVLTCSQIRPSCCPDVLSAMHLPADFLVHYGHACLTP